MPRALPIVLALCGAAAGLAAQDPQAATLRGVVVSESGERVPVKCGPT